ncbi:uncharacterized mitochondrial protein AtMg00810-like [Solanum dulcamara]|uniref:uncharacterized mitochondrial protein AtMg00810-like n=1 Tax=Solanum dulcamara TaxID=45834 RepID=UPI00248591F4|nr:uncharacterized mitochondrial protein AtMg00810-like [Solanum dulcamara]
MEKVFEMTDLGIMKFKMQDCKPVNTPISTGVKLGKGEDSEKVDDSMYRSLNGGLLYLTASRPDILFLVSLLFRRETMNLVGYSDRDWGGYIDDSRSTSGYLFCLGTICFSRSTRKQETIAQSTAEAEYIAAASVVNQATG